MTATKYLNQISEWLTQLKGEKKDDVHHTAIVHNNALEVTPFLLKTQHEGYVCTITGNTARQGYASRTWDQIEQRIVSLIEAGKLPAEKNLCNAKPPAESALSG